MRLRIQALAVALFLLPTTARPQAELTIPAFTAYAEPDGSARINQNGISRWEPGSAISWYGNIKATGRLSVQVTAKGFGDQPLSMQLLITCRDGETSTKLTADLKPTSDGSAIADFGTTSIAETGYFSFELKCLQMPTKNGTITFLKLGGGASEGAHFNMKPRRNAASVHLSYPVSRETEVDAFYCETTALEDPIWSFYMACGWHRGYFGMQVNSPTERRIIFSVWDSGSEAVDRKKVTDENRVQLMGKGEGVYSGDFGNEGTGGHSHLKFLWKTGEKQRFLVTAKPVSKTHTVYSGYYFRRDLDEWMLISSWKAPKEGGYMRGLHSFSENFVGRNGQLLRKARYGNQWYHTSDGKWHEITTAKFSHDPTGKGDRLDRFMGVEEGQFFLSHGGFRKGFVKYGTPFDRSSSGRSPAKMKLPELP